MPHKNRADFIDMQFEFTKAIRDQEKGATPLGLSAKRIGVYQQLLFNNVEGFCASAYPITKNILGDNWLTMVRKFFKHHHSQTPLFREIAEEFLEYVQEKQNLPAYMLELMHYEWVELALSTLEEDEGLNEQATRLKAIDKNSLLKLKNTSWVLAYNYPVYEISPENIPTEPQPSFLLVYRDSEDEIKFILLNPQMFLLLQAFEAEPNSFAKAQGYLELHQGTKVTEEEYLPQLQKLLEKSVLQLIINAP